MPHNAFVTFANAKKALKPHDLPLGNPRLPDHRDETLPGVGVAMIYYILLLILSKPNVVFRMDVQYSMVLKKSKRVLKETRVVLKTPS